jgi:hypothetical protein
MVATNVSWKEYRLYLSEPPRGTEHYAFVREILITYVEQNSIQNFLILNYRDPQRDMIRFRIETTEDGFENARTFLNDLVTSRRIVRFEEEDWDPRTDAANRIESARKRIERGLIGHEIYREWIVSGKTGNLWMISRGDYTRKVDQLTTVFGKIVGQMTRIFYKNFEEKPEDVWLMSILLHLLINSLDYSGPDPPSEETFIREFPPL